MTSTGHAGQEGAHQSVDFDPWKIFGVAAVGVFLVVSSISSLNVALPSMQVDLGASSKALQWVVDSYAVVFGGLLLTGGAISDRLGRRQTLLIGFAIVAIAGVGGGLSTTVDVVIGARVLAGVGAALMLPATLSVLTEVFEGPEQARAIAMWSGLAGAGSAIGPAVGGWLISWSSWASVFFGNAALAVVGLIGTALFVPTLPILERRSLDLIGSVLSVSAIGGVLFAIIESRWLATMGGAGRCRDRRGVTRALRAPLPQEFRAPSAAARLRSASGADRRRHADDVGRRLCRCALRRLALSPIRLG